MDGSLDDRDAHWCSCDASGVALPATWFSLRPIGARHEIILKDHGKYYHNEFVDATTFRYELPPRPKAHEQPVVDLLRAAATSAPPAVGDKRPLPDAVPPSSSSSPPSSAAVDVHLFCIRQTRQHYMGVFDVARQESDHDRALPRVFLRRRRGQGDPRLFLRTRAGATTTGDRHRSKSEARHEAVLRHMLPAGWLVEHEPEAASILNLPLVVDGRMRSWAGDGYTIDFVACSPDGLRRLCVESKASLDDALDPVTLDKARALRDKTLTRVLIVCGHGAEMRWLDLGAPGSGATETPPTPVAAFPVTDL